MSRGLTVDCVCGLLFDMDIKRGEHVHCPNCATHYCLAVDGEIVFRPSKQQVDSLRKHLAEWAGKQYADAGVPRTFRVNLKTISEV